MFLKGCPLRCLWCSNPECLRPYPEVGVYPDRCLGVEKCGLCFSDCPGGQGFFVLDQGRVTAINRESCSRCLSCAEACPANALVVWGKKYTALKIVETALTDVDFYARSGGGITISGGDPLMQWQFSLAVLKGCQKQGIHTCLETEHYVDPAVLEQIYPYVDLIITDIKHMDPQKHREYTGVDNELILQNIALTAKRNIPMVIRIPVIFGHNDDEENIKATADFISGKLGKSTLQVQLLPYRLLGLEKYQALGMPYGMGNFQPPERTAWERRVLNLVEQLKFYGLPACAGSSSKSG